MLAEAFLDTSILLEAANSAPGAQGRHATAQGLLTTSFGLSTQVLAEFYDHATGDVPAPLDLAVASRWVELLAEKPVQPTDPALVQAAIAVSQDRSITLGDAMVLAAAEKLGCKTLYSERFVHGQTYGSVRVVNPFLPDTPAEEG